VFLEPPRCRPPLRPLGLGLGLILTLSACGDSEQTHEFSDVRDREQPRQEVPADMTPGERLGMSTG